MTVKTYQYEMKGSGSNGNTWETSGSFNCDWNDTFMTAMRDTFQQLTSGRAIFGQPGIGCQGPYDIHFFTIEQVRQ